MIPVPPMGAVDDVVVDRRTGESWTVRVEPFELAEGVDLHVVTWFVTTATPSGVRVRPGVEHHQFGTGELGLLEKDDRLA